jgi:hypothetical protein
MKTKIMIQENPCAKAVHKHLERPDHNKTFCGNRYNEEWRHTADFVLGEDNLDDHITCGTCRSAAEMCLKREDDDSRWVIRKHLYNDEYCDWGHDLPSRAMWGVSNVLVWDLKVGSHDDVKKFTEHEVKTIMRNAISAKLLSDDLTRIKNIGKKSAREISLWLGLNYERPKSKLELRRERAINTCIQVMMEKGVPSMAFDAAMKEWMRRED